MQIVKQGIKKKTNMEQQSCDFGKIKQFITRHETEKPEKPC